MSQSQTPSTRAREAAVAWIVRQDAGPLGTAEAARFEAWRADPAHARAYAQARAVWGEMALATAPAPAPSARRARARSSPAQRTRWLGAGLAAAAAALVAAWIAPDAWIALNANAATGAGQIRHVALADGSSLTLDARSAVAIDYGPAVRAVRLLRGEAVFHVTRDPARPFVVEAAGGTTRALGTIFVVRRAGRGAVVTGVEHTISVRYPAGGAASRVLGPGQAVAYDGARGLSEPAPAPDGADAFERHELVFDNRPLGEVVETLNRYQSGHIQLIGEDVGRIAVSGVFRADDPAGALAALQTRLGLRSVRLTEALILVYR